MSDFAVPFDVCRNPPVTGLLRTDAACNKFPRRRVAAAGQPHGGSPRLCFAPKVRALAGALVKRLLGRLPAGCRHAAEFAVGTSGRAEAPGCVSYRRCALARAMVKRLQVRLPAGCRHAAEFASGRAEAPGYVSHQRCPRWRARW